jgi:alpha-ketoglutarate-dependent 2,4-dichlorophenoxyacetate dioxygenase
MSYEEGQKLVRDLIKHCTQPQYTISVKWEQPSDLVSHFLSALVHGDVLISRSSGVLGYATASRLVVRTNELERIDNRTTMHTATPFDDQAEKRDMRRTTVFDDGPDAFGARRA